MPFFAPEAQMLLLEVFSVFFSGLALVLLSLHKRETETSAILVSLMPNEQDRIFGRKK
jgi:hypothetical protein